MTLQTKSIKFHLLIRLIGLILLGVAYQPFAAANDVIKVQFVQRPPYIKQTKTGAIEGLLSTRVEHIFTTAGITMAWDLTSLNRQWDSLQNPNEMTCSVGWFKVPAREKFVKYTKAIYQDQQFVLLARKEFLVKPNDILETVLEMKTARMLLKSKYSYGPKIDEMVSKSKASMILSDGENQQMANLLIANRADFMFAAKEEAEYLIENNDPNKELHILVLPNMPMGEKRYIACNRLVTDELIERLNNAIVFACVLP